MFNGSLLTVCRVRQKQRSMIHALVRLACATFLYCILVALYLIFMKKTTMLKRDHLHLYSELANVAA